MASSILERSAVGVTTTEPTPTNPLVKPTPLSKSAADMSQHGTVHLWIRFTIIADDFQHQLHEHVGTQHPPAAHQPCCWAGGFHAQQRLCFAPFASHLGGGLLDHMWANLHHTWPPVKQIPFVEEAWFSDHLAVGCEHQPCRLL